MKLAGQISAAIEVLADIEKTHRPASLALGDWGRSHRFAGSRDRSVIGTLVYDALRKRSSLGWMMGDDKPRALLLGVLRHVWQLDVDAIAALCDGSQFGPLPLGEAEMLRLGGGAPDLTEMPGPVAADMPAWLFDDVYTVQLDRAIAVGKALAERAPIDIRVNTLKSDRDRVLKAFQKYGATPTPYSPAGVRIPAPGPQAKNPNIEAETAHGKGWFEVQDEASQIACFISRAAPRQQILDLCAGSGGKTLGFAALSQNTGQIFAYDNDKQRLRPIFERLKRSGARNVQVLSAGDAEALASLTGKMDLVFVDAPCSGSGVWRRRPDSKWRLTPEALMQRVAEQREVLNLAAPLVRPGGTLIYATCSILPAENSRQTSWFLGQHENFIAKPWQDSWDGAGLGPLPDHYTGGLALQLDPAFHGTDGFYVSILRSVA
ncbi:MAG: RsmB/NOP family class I SAM-dependent RNA methyltransferase [Hyphomicrobiales bacterium]|nr:RsmB/NOP family class I SAM-dependent RNA methyltransferase [Hyphomicrobiales bacterium]